MRRLATETYANTQKDTATLTPMMSLKEISRSILSHDYDVIGMPTENLYPYQIANSSFKVLPSTVKLRRAIKK